MEKMWSLQAEAAKFLWQTTPKVPGILLWIPPWKESSANTPSSLRISRQKPVKMNRTHGAFSSIWQAITTWKAHISTNSSGCSRQYSPKMWKSMSLWTAQKSTASPNATGAIHGWEKSSTAPAAPWRYSGSTLTAPIPRLT